MQTEDQRSLWEKSFDKLDFRSQWEIYCKRNRDEERRVSHRRYPESKTHFISFWVDDDQKCEELKENLVKYKCDWVILTRTEKQNRYYIEGVVRYDIPKSRQWVLRTMSFITNGLCVSRILYNDWEQWLSDYIHNVWYEQGQKPMSWHQIERRYMKRRIQDESGTGELKIKIKRQRLLHRNVRDRSAIEEEYQKQLAAESDTEIDERN